MRFWNQVVAVAACVLLGLAGLARGAERKETRVLYDFEDTKELDELRAHAENVTLELSPDLGVTRGRTSCRLIAKPGVSAAVIEIQGEKLKDWQNFDYFAMDVYTDRQEPVAVMFELWDQTSRDGEYSTRLTFDGGRAGKTHAGQNTLIWPINRAVRNRKAELNMPFDQVLAKDKIDVAALYKVRIFFKPAPDGGDTNLWIDNLRLVQEDALGGKIEVALPPGAAAFQFGLENQKQPGFTWIGAAHPGVSGPEVRAVGGAWPDPLTGSGLTSDKGAFKFQTALPNGEYRLWLCAGKVLDEKTRTLPFVLKVNGRALCDERPTEQEFYGEKYLFRFMHTQYSQRPDALWLDYVEPVCPAVSVPVTVTDGQLTVEACNHRLAALIAVPAAAGQESFNQMGDALQTQRRKLFYAPLFFQQHDAPRKAAGDGAYLLWLPAAVQEPAKNAGDEKPDFTRRVLPWSAPSDAERAQKTLDLTAALGQHVSARVYVTAFDDLGRGKLEISDLTGAGTIPAASVKLYYQNYRVRDTSAEEQALFPWTDIRFEAGLTWAYWLWFQVPADAAPGEYQGTITFRPEKGGPQTLAIKLRVYPFKLASTPPVAFGFAYHLWDLPAGVDRRENLKAQYAFMRQLGLTATEMACPNITALNPDGHVAMKFDPMPFEVARETGLGAAPDQRSACFVIFSARQIARLLGLGNKVDQEPGCELKDPKFRGYYQDILRQMKAFLADKVPVSVMVADEPREMCMPWNRNLEDTITYCDYVREIGLTQHIDIGGDKSGERDYTPLVDHLDIVSVHAYTSSKGMIARAQKLKKQLWFYNTGRDRLSWGFYVWRMAAAGRWEWHWYFGNHPVVRGYPNPVEYYTPFFAPEGYVEPAPYFTYPAGLTFQPALLDVQQGIIDYAYATTLEQAVAAARNDPAKAKIAAEAEDFLQKVKAAIPTLPAIRNLASPEASALVGAGMDTPAAGLCEPWRRKMAEYLIALRP